MNHNDEGLHLLQVGSGILDCCYSQPVGDISRLAFYFTRQDDLNMPFSDWIPTEELRTLSKYLIADFAALSVFKILTLYAEFLFPQQRAIIINIELNGLFLLIGTMLLLLIIKI